MIIELRNIHAKWKLLIGDTCILTVNGNETMWSVMAFGVYGCFTNKWKTNYMGRVNVVRLRADIWKLSVKIQPRI
jgi:hypothetical protein